MGIIGAIPFCVPFPCQPLKHGFRSVRRRDGERRQMQLPKLERHLAAFRDAHGVSQRLRHILEMQAHLLGRFQVQLVGIDLQPVFILHGFAGLDADQDFLRARVRPVDVMHVVGRDQRNAGFLRKRHQRAVHLQLLGKPVVLQLQIEVSPAHDGVQPQRERPCTRHVPIEDGVWNVAGQTGGHGDEPLVARLEQRVIDARLVVKTVDKALGHQLHEIPVAGVILRQQHQMPLIGIRPRIAVEAGTGGRVYLTANDGRDAGCPAGLVEIHDAIKHAVVRDGQMGHAQFLRPRHQRPHTRGAVEQAEFGMHMQMGERDLFVLRHHAFMIP